MLIQRFGEDTLEFCPAGKIYWTVDNYLTDINFESDDRKKVGRKFDTGLRNSDIKNNIGAFPAKFSKYLFANFTFD